MKNFDETRQQLKKLGWRRSDRTNGRAHVERWYQPSSPDSRYDYDVACRRAGITPAPTPLRHDPRPPYRRRKRWQLKHLDTKVILTFIADFQKRTGRWCLFYDLDEQLNGWTNFPQPLRMAKMRRLLAHGYVTGCACGCRGDFELTTKGLAFINRENQVRPGLNAKVNGRAVSDLWWEDDFSTMCVKFDDTGEVSKFFGCRLVGMTPSKIEGGVVEVSAVIAPAPIEFIPITYTIAQAKEGG